MHFRSGWKVGVAVAVACTAVLPACSRRKEGEVNPIVPQIGFNRSRIALGSAVEVTYTWTLEPGAKKLTQDYRALVHFLDSHEVMLFEDDHVPTPPPALWEPGKTYSYTRTKFIPNLPYVGEVEVRMGLYPVSGRGERVPLKGNHKGMREYQVTKTELLPRTENIFLVYKEGWHSPESSPQNPSLERTWTMQEALASFTNPKQDIIVYLEADTNFKAFDKPPVLTVSIGGKAGVTIPIQDSEVFLKRIRVKAADLGQDQWVDLKLTMNQSFVPKQRGINQDDRTLGLLVYNLFVGEAAALGSLPADSAVDAGPLAVPSPAATKPAAPAKGATAVKK
jgi:hypothetical protein